MNSEESATGCISASREQRERLAQDSVFFNLTKVPNFEQIFGEYFEKIGFDEAKLKILSGEQKS
jgi:hypothetical protein